MGLFSQRIGKRPAAKAPQRESMDDDLRNRLWSGLSIGLWNRWSPPEYSGFQYRDGQVVEQIAAELWVNHFKLPLDTQPPFNKSHGQSTYSIIRDHFFKCEWFEVYDLIEFILGIAPDDWAHHLKDVLNGFLQAENSAYRIVGLQVVEIVDEVEIAAVESAVSAGVRSSREHIARAMELLSDRKNPDYRNSIKESISAVEAACQTVTNMPKATLGDCIKVLKDKGAMHPAFESAVSKLYGYTSDAGGIRHALTDDAFTPAQSDARFMLVACSAFIGFLWSKTAELNIDVGG